MHKALLTEDTFQVGRKKEAAYRKTYIPRCNVEDGCMIIPEYSVFIQHEGHPVTIYACGKHMKALQDSNTVILREIEEGTIGEQPVNHSSQWMRDHQFSNYASDVEQKKKEKINREHTETLEFRATAAETGILNNFFTFGPAPKEWNYVNVFGKSYVEYALEDKVYLIAVSKAGEAYSHCVGSWDKEKKVVVPLGM